MMQGFDFSNGLAELNISPRKQEALENLGMDFSSGGIAPFAIRAGDDL